jgi:hypothetical protein
MGQSNKHHYLPIFYLKGFTNEHNQFAIHDKKRTVLKKGMFYPASHFYENERNTIEANGLKGDILEEVYSTKDNIHSKLLRLFQNSAGIPDLLSDQLIAFQGFLSLLFWRLPETDILYLKEYQRNHDIRRVIRFIDEKTNEEIVDDKTIAAYEDPAMIKFMRSHVSDVSLLSTNKLDLNKWRIAYTTSGFKLCSDMPFIFRKEIPNGIFDCEFIFPITKHHLMVKTAHLLEIKEMGPEMSLKIDMLIFMQAKKYCCCARRDYLEVISIFSKRFCYEELREEVFFFFENHQKETE